MAEHPSGHNYTRKLLAHVEATGITPGAVRVAIYHDAWCGIFKDRRCNCDPELSFRPLVEGER